MDSHDLVAVDTFAVGSAHVVLAHDLSDGNKGHAGDLGDRAGSENKHGQNDVGIPTEASYGEDVMSELAGQRYDRPLQQESGEEAGDGDSDSRKDQDS